MNILFITDDRSEYSSGNYYLAYLRGFQSKHAVTVTDLTSRPDLSQTELIVIGHGGQDHLLRQRTVRAFLPWNRYPHPKKKFVDLIAQSNLPKIVFSKNDYKAIDQKKELQRFLGARLLVTHSKSAAAGLSQAGKYKTIWMPFGIDASLFYPRKIARSVDVGFRGNKNSAWNDGERERFMTLIRGALGKNYALDLVLAEAGENFLLGEKYVAWLSSCHLVANTVSAIGTVGPRFLESIACGCVPLAPPQEYEGLLRPDEHYIAAQSEEELRNKVREFFSASSYRTTLLEAGAKLVQNNLVQSQIDQTIAQLKSL